MVLTLLQFKEMDKLLTVKLPPYGPALRVDTTWFENEAMNGVAAIKQRFQELVNQIFDCEHFPRLVK